MQIKSFCISDDAIDETLLRDQDAILGTSKTTISTYGMPLTVSGPLARI